MSKQKLVYIASPVRAILDRMMHIDDAHKEIIGAATEAAKIVKRAGHIPVSPVLLWFGVFNDYTDRKLLMRNCLALLKLCDELYVSKSKYTKFSEGIKIEIEWAKELGITEVQYESS
ncbi:MAG: DUF4406 domain-containing protein [Campylobacteraceae bacterium]|jgi:hypothetical protein|nr:DUF4406 domain-containing protein [Campylobacteraceae bacterium]